eukprot:gene3035-4768_t
MAAVPSSAGLAAASVTIEFCPGCRWQHRASWMAGELLTTFGSRLRAVVLRPAAKAGVFNLFVERPGSARQLLSSREQDGGFPELAAVKRKIKQLALPDVPLGHSENSKTFGSTPAA